jgi:hypothetical protein
MANIVKFVKGTQASYDALSSKDPNTFYYIGTDLYLGSTKITSTSELASALSRLDDAETAISNKVDKTTVATSSTLGLVKSGTDISVDSSGNVSVVNDSHTHDGRYYTESEIDTKLDSKLNSSLKGAKSGLAELDANGLVPTSQLPSFVDDVIEGYLYSSKFYSDSAHTTAITGETGKIYVDLSTNKTYRWSGSAFVTISDTIALGETSSTAYRGDRGKTAYDHSQSTHARTDATKTAASTTNGNILINDTETTVYTHPSGTNPHGTTKSDVGLGNVGNFKAVSTVASQGLSTTEQTNARTNIGLNKAIISGSQTTTSTTDGGSNVYTFTDASGSTSTLTVKNGSKGSTGSTGATGTSISSVTQTTTSTADAGTNVITVTLSDGTSSTFNVKNGSKGGTGSAGAAGTRGSLWYSGTAITGTSTTETIFSGSGITSALVNDYYLNTSTGYVYKCSTAGAASAAKWVYVGSIKGATGSQGATGATGSTGAAGTGIKSVSQTTTSTADAGTNVVTVTLTDGTSSTFNVKNGSKGSTGTTPTIKVASGSNISSVGTPTVTASTSGTTTTFTFDYLKGATGAAGTNATTTAVATTSANGLMSSTDKNKVDNLNIVYCTCSTAAATAAKEATVQNSNSNFALTVGAIAVVKYTYTNTASSCTLNIGGTGAKQIYYSRAVYTGTSSTVCGYTNTTITYMYDGTYWTWVSYGADTNSNTYTSAYCSTAAATAAKTATCTSYALLSKSYIQVIIATANTSASALTLNINGKGAKPIYINGSASSSSNYTLPAGSYFVYYDGTNYYFRTDGAITGPSFTGKAATATKLATARTLKIGNKGYTFDGSANVTWSLADIGVAASVSDDGTTLNLTIQ